MKGKILFLATKTRGEWRSDKREEEGPNVRLVCASRLRYVGPYFATEFYFCFSYFIFPYWPFLG